MKTITKEQWLEAYEQTRSEYINGTHKCRIQTCAKCILLNDTESCTGCPEQAHIPTDRLDIGEVGCTKRSIRPEHSYKIDNKTKNDLIEYHTKAINYLKRVKNYSLARFMRRLRAIDKEISNK